MSEKVNLSNLEGLDYYRNNAAIGTIDRLLNLQFGDFVNAAVIDILKLIEIANISDTSTVDKYIAGQIDVQKLADACNSVGDCLSSFSKVTRSNVSKINTRKRKLSDVCGDDISLPDAKPLPDAKRFKRSTLIVHKTQPHTRGRTWKRVNGNQKLKQLLINMTCKRLNDERFFGSQSCCGKMCWSKWESFAVRRISWPLVPER